MHPTLLSRYLIVAFLGLLPTLNAFAGGDLEPPDYRYAPLSTVSGWDFVTDQQPKALEPDLHLLSGLFGKAPLPIQALEPGAANTPHGRIFGDLEWTPDLGGSYLTEMTSGSHGITFLVPSWIEVLAPGSDVRFQKLRIQVTHKGEEPRVWVAAMPGLPGAVKSAVREKRVRSDVPLAPHGSSFFFDDWLTSPGTWHIVIITFAPETWLQDVVIDTGSFTVEPPSIFDDGFEDGDH